MCLSVRGRTWTSVQHARYVIHHKLYFNLTCIGCSERRLIGHTFYRRNFLRKSCATCRGKCRRRLIILLSTWCRAAASFSASGAVLGSSDGKINVQSACTLFCLEWQIIWPTRILTFPSETSYIYISREGDVLFIQCTRARAHTHTHTHTKSVF
jgi:hypothetical protein